VVLGLIVLLALALRVGPFRQTLFGDELFTFDETRGGLGDVFRGMERNEVNPPLYYMLAWGARHVGGHAYWIRLPSLLAGLGTLPLLYALGRRVAGPTAGLVAATLLALSPFEIFYSTEARAYSLLIFLSLASTLALLRALERGSVARWALYAILVSAAMYTQYTAVFVIGVQAAWALVLHRRAVVPLLVAYALAALTYLPWLPSLHDQQDQKFKLAVVAGNTPATLESLLKLMGRLLPGHPYISLAELPGRLPVVVLAAAGITALVLVAARARRGEIARPGLRSPLVLVGLLALATPVGLLVYSAVGTNLMGSRNLLGSVPYMLVLLGALAVMLRPRQSWVVTAVGLGALAVASVSMLQANHGRPAYDDAAAFVEAHGAPSDPVVLPVSAVGPFAPGSSFGREHPIYRLGVDDAPAWARARSGGDAFQLIGAVAPTLSLPRLGGPDGLYVLRQHRRFPGFVELEVGRYAGRVGARLVPGTHMIEFSDGTGARVVPGAVRGFVEEVREKGDRVELGGWAADRARAADRVLAFFGRRLVGSAVPTVARPDVPLTRGPTALAGWKITARGPGAARGLRGRSIRVFAVVGARAAELPRLKG
jgi:hypothetical protein